MTEGCHMPSFDLSATLDFDSLPVGREGLWEWVAAVRRGERSELVIEASQRDPAAVARIFGLITRALELACAASRVATGRELAEVVGEAAQAELALKAGTARLCGDCGLFWVSTGFTATHCACGAPIDDAKSKHLAEQAYGAESEVKQEVIVVKQEENGGWF